IRKRENEDRWEARYMGADGKRKSLYGETRQEVAAKLATAIRDRDKGLPAGADGRQTVAQYLGEWLAAVRHTLGPKTWRRYSEYVHVHITPSLGRMPLVKLTAQQVQRLYAARLEAGLSPTTVHHLHSVLHKALEDAMRLGLVPRNI